MFRLIGPEYGPSCPSWFDPAKWESRRRICAYLTTEEPPPGLTVEEKAYVDELWAACRVFGPL